MSQHFSDIAKEITIAAIQQGLITPIKKAQYKDAAELSEYNLLRAKDIGDFYKTVAKAVNDTVQGDFRTSNEQD